jgi:hypothetical protein
MTHTKHLSSFIRAAPLSLMMVAIPLMVDGQALRWGLSGGGAASVWSGPYQEGGRLSPALAVWTEVPPTSRLVLRAEAGAGHFAADFGAQTALTVGHLHLGALARLYSGQAAPSRRGFAELGAAAWRRMFCDVDSVGTEECEDWRPLLQEGGTAPLTPRPGGLMILAGAGFRFERLGINLRYAHVVGPILETPEAQLRVRQYLLAAEWALGR